MARRTYFDLNRSADDCPGSESGYAQRFQCGNIVKRPIWTRMIQGSSRRLSFASTEAVILVEQVLKLIQPRQRRAIELTYYEGLTAEQASEVTGESVRVVRHNIYRGLEKLRTVLCNKSPEGEQKDGKLAERSRRSKSTRNSKYCAPWPWSARLVMLICGN